MWWLTSSAGLDEPDAFRGQSGTNAAAQTAGVEVGAVGGVDQFTEVSLGSVLAGSNQIAVYG